MFFNVQAHNESIAVFKDTMSRIESDSLLQQAVSSSIDFTAVQGLRRTIASSRKSYNRNKNIDKVSFFYVGRLHLKSAFLYTIVKKNEKSCEKKRRQ